jgi:MFS family permease
MFSLLSRDVAQSIRDPKLRNDLRFVTLGVVFGIVFVNVTTGAPIAGFANALGFGDLLYAFLLALPVLGGALQVFASLVLERTKKRKLAFLLGGFANRVPWLFVALLPLWVSDRRALFGSFAGLLFCTACGGAFLAVSFMSWVADLVPLELRGRFFGHRSLLGTVSSLVSGLCIGWFLDTVSRGTGFSVVIALAAILGILDILCFVRVQDPPMRYEEEYRGSIIRFFREVFAHPPFFRFLLFAVFWYFAFNVASPFFNLYMIRDLHMDFFHIALYVQAVANCTTLFSIRLFGRLTDRFGNVPVALLATSVASFLPLLWCLTTEANWRPIVLVIQILAGIFWPAIDLTVNNLALKLSPDLHRSFYIAVLNLFLGVFGNALGYIAGGIVLETLAPSVAHFMEGLGVHFSPYYVVFLLSALLRFVATFVFLPRVREERAFPLRDVFRALFEEVR